jgi:hypothetical protein
VGRNDRNTQLKKEERKIAVDKMSKRSVLRNSFLIFLLAATLVTLFLTSIAMSPPIHDVAVTDIRLMYNTTVVFPTWNGPLEINVTVKNNGECKETFNVTAYYNETQWNPIETQTVTKLAEGAEKNVNFTWDCRNLPGYPDDPDLAWPYPVYEIKANASVVLGETNTTDNELVDGTVKVQWPGDCNGDGHVNETDVDIFLSAWCKQYPDSEYNCTADFNGDGSVDLTDEMILLNNMHKGPLDAHDVAVVNITFSYDTTVVYPTWGNRSLEVNVTIKNKSWVYNETNLNVTTHFYNETEEQWNLINETTIDNLTNETEETISFEWNCSYYLPGYPDSWSEAWPYPVRTVKSNVSRVNKEENTWDNVHNASVTVQWPGDCNGDGHVNQTDEDIFLSAWCKQYPDSEYNCTADFNGDGVIDLDDLMKLLDNWHKGPLDYCDINVTSITLSLDTTVVYTNCSLQINVAVKNNGNNTETVQVTAYYNTTAVDFTVIDTKQVNITAGDEEPLTFTWNIPNATWSYLNYTIKANATLGCDENPDNNERIDGTVTVRWPGDCNGDGHVNATDLLNLTDVARDSPYYDPCADFNGDNLVDIKDVIILADNWEKGPLDP